MFTKLIEDLAASNAVTDANEEATKRTVLESGIRCLRILLNNQVSYVLDDGDDNAKVVARVDVEVEKSLVGSLPHSVAFSPPALLSTTTV